MIKTIIITFLGAFLITSLALAQGKGACKTDADKFCAGIEKGEGRIAKCLKEHENELSADCKNNMAEKKKIHEAMGKNCVSDVTKYCASEKQQHKGIVPCLVKNKSSLTSECSAAVDKIQQHRENKKSKQP